VATYAITQKVIFFNCEKSYLCETPIPLNKSEHRNNPFEEVIASMRPLFSSLEKFLLQQIFTFEDEVRDAAKESIAPKGKFIRPTLVFASASGGNFNEDSLVRRAAIVEMTHLSTLIHDDVIDNATMRRNVITPNKKYGARTAILLGDAIFAHTMSLAFEENDQTMSLKTAACVRTICEGEIKQTLADKNKNVTRQRYYEIAYGKTAVLFELACVMGALCINKEGWPEAAGEVGKQLGIAYQIYDDICDWFMSESDAGKTLGTDLISGKQTYPLIILLEKLPESESSALAQNLAQSEPQKIASMMRELNVPQECQIEFSRRITIAEDILKDYPREGAKLLEFCSAMRKLKMG